MRVLLIPLEVERWADPQGRSIESSFPSGTGPRRPELPGERNAPTKIDMAAPSVALALGGGPPWEGVLPEGGMGMFFFWKLLLFLLSFVFLLMPPPLADSSTAAVRSGPRVHGVAQGSEPAPGACLTTLVLYRPPNSVRG